MKRISNASGSLAVYDLDAVSATEQRLIDLPEDTGNRFLNRQAVQVDPADDRCPAVPVARPFFRIRSSASFSFWLGRRHQVVFAAGDNGVLHLNAIAPTAPCLYNDASLLSKRDEDDDAAYRKRHLLYRS